MRTKSQSGRGGLVLVLLLAIVGVAAYLAWGALHQQSPTAVTTTPVDATNALSKVQALTNASAQAQRSGKPVAVTETFTDAELSALANQAASNKGLPVDQISLHATGSGVIQGSAQAHVAGQTLPVNLQGTPVISGDRVALNVTSTQVGSIPLPGGVTSQVTDSLKQLTIGQAIPNVQNLKVTVNEGQLTVSGTAVPA